MGATGDPTRRRRQRQPRGATGNLTTSKMVVKSTGDLTTPVKTWAGRRGGTWRGYLQGGAGTCASLPRSMCACGCVSLSHTHSLSRSLFRAHTLVSRSLSRTHTLHGSLSFTHTHTIALSHTHKLTRILSRSRSFSHTVRLRVCARDCPPCAVRADVMHCATDHASPPSVLAV